VQLTEDWRKIIGWRPLISRTMLSVLIGNTDNDTGYQRDLHNRSTIRIDKNVTHCIFGQVGVDQSGSPMNGRDSGVILYVTMCTTTRSIFTTIKPHVLC
jgi:hypothetical protein